MTKSNFEPSLALVLAHEGGFVDHPKDPGGPTNKGVTQRVYDGYRTANKLATRSVKVISDKEVGEIYRQQYWGAIRGDELPQGLDYAVFDFAVNSGVTRAIRNLQLCLGVVADGHFGNVTLSAVNRAKPSDLIIALCGRRMEFLRSLATFGTFGKGWTRRVVGAVIGYQANDSGVLDHALNMAAKAVGIEPSPLEMPKAVGSVNNEAEGGKAVYSFEPVSPPNKPISYEELKLKRWVD